jgi:hypothetical protein
VVIAVVTLLTLVFLLASLLVDLLYAVLDPGSAMTNPRAQSWAQATRTRAPADGGAVRR